MASRILNYIESNFVQGEAKESFQLKQPDSGEAVAEVVQSGLMDLVAATQVCAAEGLKWPKIPMNKRVDILEKFVKGLERNVNVIEKLMVRYLGYSFAQAHLEGREAVLAGRYVIARARKKQDVTIMPRGVLGFVMSSVSPFYYFCDQVLMALVLGNRIIIKPHPQASPIIDGILRIYSQLGLPHSCIQVIHGQSFELCEALVEHPSINGIVYMGNDVTGVRLHKSALDGHKFFHGQYGGRNPVILGRELNFARHGDELKKVFFSTHFLSCFRGSRVFVPEKTYVESVEKITKIVETTLGEKYVGALSTQEQYDTFHRQVVSLQNEGANVAKYGKSYADRPGYKVSLRVAEDMKNCSTFQQDQSIGPLITLTRYKNIAEAVKFANTSPWGLAGYVFNDDFDKAREWAKGLRVGHIFVNRYAGNLFAAPFYAYGASGETNGLVNWDLFQIKKTVNRQID